MFSMARSICCVSLLCAVGLAGAQTTEMPTPEAFVEGETWEWRRVDALTQLEEGRSVRTVVKTDEGLAFSIDGKTRSIPLAAEHGAYNPSAKPWRVWPLAVGKRWDFEANWSRPDGVSGNTQQKAEVVAYEEVSVPAGQFMAYRLEYRGFFNTSRGTNGQQNDTYWYAPDVKANVKHIRSSGRPVWTTELMSYKKPAP